MKKLIVLVLLALAISYSLIRTAESKEDARSRLKAKLRKPDVIDQKFIAENDWKYLLRSNGSFMFDSDDIDHDGNNAGGIFPRAENRTIVYASGIYIATLKQGIPVCSEVEFSSEFQPGRITNSGTSWDSLLAEDPNSSNQKVYYLDRHNLSNEWPEDAPRDMFGKPALMADAQTWTVFNDRDTSLSQEGLLVSPNPGLGIEVVMESFVFNMADAVFFKLTIFNKTNVPYPGTYLGIFSDADVNADGSTNDISGIDTSRGLGFVYNSTNADFPMAVGYDFVQGPLVKTDEIPIKEAGKFSNNRFRLIYNPVSNLFDISALGPDVITLAATSFANYIGATDPRNNSERYYILKGLHADGSPKTGSGYSDYYMFRGDPLTPGASSDPNVERPPGYDVRILLGTGPFTLPADSSQEIWFAFIGAKGTDRLDAVRQLFDTDDKIQFFFDRAMASKYYPTIPITQITALENTVSIEWQDNAEHSEDSTGEVLGITQSNGFSPDYIINDFQGYRVYRSRTGLDGSFTMLAQYDKIDSFGIVTNRWINANGHLIIEDIDLGDNTGLQYQFIDSNLINGQKYFYSVTAYDAQPYIATSELITVDGLTIRKPAGIPVSLESSILANIHSATPMVSPASALKKVLVVPNPFYVTAHTTSVILDKQIKFTRLPSNCSIKIFTVSGDLVKIIYHNSSSNNERPGFSPYDENDPEPLETSTESWNLRNHRGKLVASGMYIALIEAPGIGKTTVKFAVIQ